MSENNVKNNLKDYRSECCNAPVILDGMPDFIGSKEIVTVHYVCTRCTKPCNVYKLDKIIVFEPDWNPNEKIKKNIKEKKMNGDLRETLELTDAFKEFLAELYKNLADDGKLDLGEIIGFGDNILKITTEIKDYKKIKEELSNLNKEEIKQLSAEIIEMFYQIISIIKLFRTK